MNPHVLKSAFLWLLLFAGYHQGFGQTPGLIFKPATEGGEVILDRDGNGYTSSSRHGFVGNDETDSEIPFRRLPVLETELLGDLFTGASGGHTDLAHAPMYAAFDGVNLLFRVRLGGQSTASKGYSFFIDADATFTGPGPNPGFEYEVLLASNFDVRVINHGVANSPVIFTGSLEKHHQRSVALTLAGGNPDFFYDFYVPLSVFGGGITASTPLRMSGVTITSAQSGLSGTVSDVGGVNFAAYGYDKVKAWRKLINAFPPTSLESLKSGEFAPVRAEAPVVHHPVKTGNSVIKGASVEAEGSVISVFQNGASLCGGAGQPACPTVAASGAWELNGIPASALVEGRFITARVAAPGKTTSALSAGVVVTSGFCTTPAPAITGTMNGNKGFMGTSDVAGEQVVKIYRNGVLYAQVPFTATTLPHAWSIANATTGNAVDNGSYTATTTLTNGCESPISGTYCHSQGNGGYTATAIPSINPTPGLTLQSTSISGTVVGNGITVFLYQNGFQVGFTTSANTGNPATWTVNLTGLTLSGGDVFTARALGAGNACLSNASNSLAVFASVSAAPGITGFYCGQVREVMGTSDEILGTEVEVYVTPAGSSTATSLGKAKVSASGFWKLANLSIAPGSSISARATAPGKGQSAFSPSVSIQVATSHVGLGVQASLKEGDREITGTYGTPGATIRVFLDGSPLVTEAPILVKSNGTWSISGLSAYEVYAGASVYATAQTNTTCESAPSPAVEVACVAPLASTVLVPSGTTVCSGSTVNLEIAEPQTGIIYQLLRNKVPFGSSVLGTKEKITFTLENLTASAEYTIQAFKISAVTCETLNEGIPITVNQVPPSNYVLSAGNSQVCSNGSTSIQVANTGSEYTYQLRRTSDNALVGEALAGNGSSLNLPTGNLIESTTFQLLVVHRTNGCTVTNAQTVTVGVSGVSADLPVSAAEPSLCGVNQGTAITVQTQANPSATVSYAYQLYTAEGVALGASFPATAAASSFTRNTGPLAPGAHSFYVLVTASDGSCVVRLLKEPKVMVAALPLPAKAGEDQTICGPNTALEATAPLVGAGVWTKKAGSPAGGTLTDPSSAVTSVTDLQSGLYTFVWTVMDAACPGNTVQDEVQVLVNCPAVYTVKPAKHASAYLAGEVLATVVDPDGAIESARLKAGSTLPAQMQLLANGSLQVLQVPLVAGNYPATIITTDAFGVESESAITVSVLADPKPALPVPGAPVIVAVSEDSGRSATDGVTTDQTLILRGTAGGNLSIRVTEASLGLIGTTTADGSGAWTLDHTATVLPEGSYSFRATATNAENTTGPASSPFVVVIDLQAPAHPLLTGITTDTGVSGTDAITSDNTVAIHGKAEAFSLVKLSLEEVGLIGTATTLPDGSWSFDYSGTELPEQTHVFSATAEDLAGNTSGRSVTFPVVVDRTAPTVVISSSQTSPTKTAFPITLTFNEKIAGLSANKVTVVNGVLSSLQSTDSQTFTATVTPTAAGEATVELAANAVTDLAGNGNRVSNRLSRTFDATKPTLAITTVAPTVTNSAFSATFTFSEEVTGFALADIVVTNGTASAFQNLSGGTYAATITPAADGQVVVSVAAEVAQDAAGNGNEGPALLVRTYDGTRPTIALSTAAPDPTKAPFTVTFTFSKEVTGFTVTDISLTNAAATNFASVNGSTYTALITPVADGQVVVSVAEGVAQDAAGNTNTLPQALTRTYDGTRPSVVLTATASDQVNGPFEVTATFDENVTGVSLSGFAVVNGTITGLEKISAATYHLLVTPAAQGEVTVTVREQAATDAAGNGNTASKLLRRTYDSVRPEVILSSTAAPVLKAPFTVTFSFSEPVDGFELADISVSNGGASGLLKVTGTEYSATVTPVVDGPVLVSVAADKTQDAAGNGNVASTQLSRTYDATRPTLVLSSSAPEPTNAPFTVTFLFSEPVTGFGLGAITLTNATVSDIQALSASRFTALVTPAAAGQLTVSVGENKGFDAAQNGNLGSNTLTRTFDDSRPGVVLASAADPVVKAPFRISITFSKEVTGFTASDLLATNGLLSGFVALEASTYSVLVIPESQGEVVVWVVADAAQDAAGNFTSASEPLSRKYDTILPTLTLTTDAPSLTNSAFTATFTFSEEVTGFALADIAVENGTASAFQTLSGSIYAALITPAADGQVVVSVVAEVAHDAAGNGNQTPAPLTRTFDGTRPAVALSTAAPDPTNAPFTVEIAFSEPVSGFALAGLSVTNGVASEFTSLGGGAYRALITPSAEGAVQIRVAADVAQDAAGNGNLASSLLARQFSSSRPSVVLSAPAPDPTKAPFTVTFTFSKEVTGFTAQGLVVTNATVRDFTPVSERVYTALVSPSADGLVSVAVAEGVAQDAAGNRNTLSQPLTRIYDATRPTVVLTSQAAPRVNAAFAVTIRFDEPVTGLGLSQIQVLNGVASSLAETSPGTYTVLIAPATDGEVSVRVPAAVATDAAGNGNLAADPLVRIFDGTRPAVVVETTAPETTNEPFEVSITFDEEVDGFSLAGLTFTNATGSGFAQISASTFKVLVTPTVAGEVTIRVAEMAAADAAGNGNAASQILRRLFDANRPSVALTAPAANPINTPFTVTVTFSKPVTGFGTDGLVVQNGLVSAFEQVSGTLYTALVTPTADGEVRVSVGSNQASDQAGNGNTASPVLARQYDGNRPAATLATTAPERVREPFLVRVTFSEAVEGLETAGIQVVNGSVSGLTRESDRGYTFLVSPGTDGEVAVSVTELAARDLAGNGSTAAVPLFRMFDQTRPTVSLSYQAASPGNKPATVTFTFSEPVKELGAEAIAVRNGVVSDLTKVSEAEYTVLITPSGDGVVAVSLPADAALDLALNGNVASDTLTWLFDATAPAGYAVHWPATEINGAHAGAANLQITGLEIGATYHYTITSDHGGSPLTGSAEAQSPAFTLAGLDLTGLADGYLTATLYQVDQAGNEGGRVSDQVRKVTRNVVEVVQPPMVKVPIRTTFSQVPLPSTVTVAYADGSTAEVGVRWLQGDYEGTVAGQYLLSGELILDNTVSNLDEHNALLIVEVEPNQAPVAVILNTTTFRPDTPADEVIGVFGSTDPDDDHFGYTLVTGEGSGQNALFEIRGDQLFLKSNKGLSGTVQFSIRVRTTDPYGNFTEKSFVLSKGNYGVSAGDLKFINGFSPNGDGVNDTWIIPELRYFNETEVEVYDRAGVRLFHSKNPEIGWDGRNQYGQILQGPFFYIIQVKDTGLVKKGVVTVLNK